MNWEDFMGEDKARETTPTGYEIRTTSEPGIPAIAVNKIESPEVDQKVRALIKAKEDARIANNLVTKIERDLVRLGRESGSQINDDSYLILTDQSEVAITRSRVLVMQEDGADLPEDVLAISKTRPSTIEIQPTYLSALEDEARAIVEQRFTEKVRDWRVKLIEKAGDSK